MSDHAGIKDDLRDVLLDGSSSEPSRRSADQREVPIDQDETQGGEGALSSGAFKSDTANFNFKAEGRVGIVLLYL